MHKAPLLNLFDTYNALTFSPFSTKVKRTFRITYYGTNIYIFIWKMFDSTTETDVPFDAWSFTTAYLIGTPLKITFLMSVSRSLSASYRRGIDFFSFTPSALSHSAVRPILIGLSTTFRGVLSSLCPSLQSSDPPALIGISPTMSGGGARSFLGEVEKR